ncbi:protein PIGBOS1 [Leptodactylus fuscus]|uniref:protein PIGBOS1 n=1 Tax=Leptodactylus fuscus TaxID=238119 RepID=UPI003F4F13D4
MISRLPSGQVVLAVLLGFAGGVYIYRPLLEKYMLERKALQADVTKTEAEKKEND